MKHVLVVGGTGMIAKATQWLNEQGYHLTLIARNRKKLQRVSEDCNFPERNHLISMDYRDSENLKKQIQDSQNQYGAFSIVLAWIHSIAPNALEIIMEEVSKNQERFKLFHVLGSSNDLQAIRRKMVVSDQCEYYQIQLGFVIEGQRSRWLTNEEISDGVILAIRDEKPITVVGTLEPWNMRP